MCIVNSLREGAHEMNKHATIRKISNDFHTLTDTSKYSIYAAGRKHRRQIVIVIA